MQQAIARVVALAAVGAENKTAQMHSLAIIILGNGKGCAAAARYEEHAIARWFIGIHQSRIVPGIQCANSSTPTIAAQASNKHNESSRRFGIEYTESERPMAGVLKLQSGGVSFTIRNARKMTQHYEHH